LEACTRARKLHPQTELKHHSGPTTQDNVADTLPIAHTAEQTKPPLNAREIACTTQPPKPTPPLLPLEVVGLCRVALLLGRLYLRVEPVDLVLQRAGTREDVAPLGESRQGAY
jgi:hypothetical protein